MALYDNINPNLTIADQEQLFDRAFSWEPKRQHHFILAVPDIPAYLVKTSGKPQISNGEVALDLINIKRYVKGKSEWSTIQMTLYDPIVPSGAQAVMEWVRLGHESVTGRDGYSDFYKKDITFNSVGPVGDYVSEWVIKGAVITSVNFGDYNWDDDGTVVNITVEVQPDYCVLNY